MRMKKKIEVSAKLNTVKVWDFGMFPKRLADKIIKVDSKKWYDFIDARVQYEMLYEELKELIKINI